MRRFSSQFALLIGGMILLLAGSVAEASIADMIGRGRIREAEDSLSNLVSASSRDGDVLYYQSLLEEDGARAAALMEAALQANVSLEYREEIYVRLIQYYVVTKGYRSAAHWITQYRVSFEDGKHAARVNRLSSLVDEMQGHREQALSQCDRRLVRTNSETERYQAEIDKARLMLKMKRQIGSNETLRRLTRNSDGDCVPQALYLLSQDAIARSRTDDAVFYYNLMREGYPSAVGLDDLIDRLTGLTLAEEDNKAEELTGTFYAVKVGVFSEADNAKRQANLFKKYGHPVNTGTRTISGKTYRVVYVGEFSDFLAAEAFKTQLEASHNEVYQVVAR